MQTITEILNAKIERKEKLPNRDYDALFASRLDELAQTPVNEDTMAQMRQLCKDMTRFHEKGYDSESIRDGYREIFFRYGFII